MRGTIETKRLILRNVVPEDYLACFKWCGDPEVNKYLIYPCYKCAEDVKTWIEGRNAEDDPDNYDLGFVLKETGELIGMGGLVYHKEDDVWEIGYNLRKDRWGNGYVPEAMQGIIDYIRSIRELNILEGEFAKENNKSRRVMEKLGMTFYKESHYEKTDGSAAFDSLVFRKDFREDGKKRI